jgi:tetratricopeptide (TPR) repeat protein
MQRHFREALKQYRLAEKTLEEHSNIQREQMQIELMRSSAFYQMGDLPNAEAALKRAAALGSPTVHDISTQAFFESSLGRVYFDLGKKETARKFIKSAARLWKSAGNPQMELDFSDLLITETKSPGISLSRFGSIF